MKITVTHRAAHISECGKYRYWLTRAWTAEGYPNLDTLRVPMWICLNPSTADDQFDDATVRSIMRISTAWGYGRFILCNIFAWRATDPRELKGRYIGGARQDSKNTCIIYDQRQRADIVIAAWGESPFVTPADAKWIEELVGGMCCPGRNKSGSPKHPLYLPTNTHMNVWTRP